MNPQSNEPNYSDVSILHPERIRALLSRHLAAQSAQDGGLRRAAVLIPLVRAAETWQVLLTHRSDTVHDHKGQVAFPGGSAEPQDVSLEETALRETWEEIGIRPEDVDVLGRMPDFPTISSYLVTPVVGVVKVWPYTLRLSSDEVARVFTIPLWWLAQPENIEIRPRIIMNRTVDVVYFKPYDGETLWGVSGMIMLDLLKILKLV